MTAFPCFKWPIWKCFAQTQAFPVKFRMCANDRHAKRKLLHVEPRLVKVMNVWMNGNAQKLIMVVEPDSVVPVWFSCIRWLFHWWESGLDEPLYSRCWPVIYILTRTVGCYWYSHCISCQQSLCEQSEAGEVGDYLAPPDGVRRPYPAIFSTLALIVAGCHGKVAIYEASLVLAAAQ